MNDNDLRARLYRATHVAGLDRLRWDLKLKLLRAYGVRPSEQPAAVLRYLLLDPELDNFTYPLDNLDELAVMLATALDRPVVELAGYVKEPNLDTTLAQDMRRAVRWRPAHKRVVRFGRRLGWYAVVRALRPQIVGETGVHDGMGSILLLRALERNAEEHGVDGRLVSFDISRDAGWMVGERLSRRWELVIGSTFETLAPALAGTEVGVFIHDSDHSYECEHFELTTAAHHAPAEQALITDNAHATSALLDIAASEELEHHLFMERPRDHWYPGAGMGLVRRLRS